MNIPPTPSPMTQTPRAHSTDTPRAQPTVRPRPQISPRPIATCRAAKAAFHAACPAVSICAVSKSARASGPGRPMLAMPRMPAMNSRVNI
jgi:hypothetical protein